MFNFLKKKGLNLKSPVDGKFLDLTNSSDEAFAKKLIGDGFAIIPSSNTIYSPIDGTVTLVFETKHAIGLKDSSGNEYLIHIGVNTVKLKGEGFNITCTQGQNIKQGDKIGEVDFDLVKEAGYSTEVLLINTNGKVFNKTLNGEDVKALDLVGNYS